MFITLLYVSAFLFFLAERKIKNATPIGIAVVFLASLPFSWRIFSCGYKILHFAAGFIPDGDQYIQHQYDRYTSGLYLYIPYRSRIIFSLVLAILFSLLFTGILMVPARLWSRELFCIPCDDMIGRKMAKRIFVAASVIPCIVAIWLYGYEALCQFLTKTFGADYNRFDNMFFTGISIQQEDREIIKAANTVYVVLLFVLCILCLILINKKSFRYKELPISSMGTGSSLSAFAITFSLSGILSFLTNAQDRYLLWSGYYRVTHFAIPCYYSFIYGQYYSYSGKFGNPIQYNICMIILVAIAAGAVMLFISMVYMAIRKKIRTNLFSFIFSAVLMLISSGCVYYMIIEIEKCHSIR